MSAQAMTETILVVDDDPVQRRLAEAALTRSGLNVRTCDSGRAALSALDEADARPVGAIVLDVIMPGLDGIAVLEKLRANGSKVPVIVQTAQGSIDVAIKAMRAGAFDFLIKPATPERLAKAVKDALKVAAMPPPAHRLNRRSRAKVADMVGGSDELERVRQLIQKAAASDIPVLIEGESGTGKELAARAIAAKGARATRSIVIVNCGAIPENLVESILFGHEKGAFTGATEKHVGKFVEADGGTLFLDEIGELPLPAQVKLLRAIQDGHVEPVGARTHRRVDVRLISATNRDLIAAVREGHFREDLFYRLNVFPIRMPSLRSRLDDIAALVEHFLKRQSAATGRPMPGVTPEALEVLMAYDWPGNIRQLENEIQRAIVLDESGELTAADFEHIAAQVRSELSPKAHRMPLSRPVMPAAAAIRPLPASRTEAARTVVAPAALTAATSADGLLRLVDENGHARSLDDIEADAIAHALSRYKGQMSEVARRLGIGRSTLYRKVREHALDEGHDSAH